MSKIFRLLLIFLLLLCSIAFSGCTNGQTAIKGIWECEELNLYLDFQSDEHGGILQQGDAWHPVSVMIGYDNVLWIQDTLTSETHQEIGTIQILFGQFCCYNSSGEFYRFKRIDKLPVVENITEIPKPNDGTWYCKELKLQINNQAGTFVQLADEEACHGTFVFNRYKPYMIFFDTLGQRWDGGYFFYSADASTFRLQLENQNITVEFIKLCSD